MKYYVLVGNGCEVEEFDTLEQAEKGAKDAAMSEAETGETDTYALVLKPVSAFRAKIEVEECRPEVVV